MSINDYERYQLFNEADLEKLIEWGFKIYPCKVLKDKGTQKKSLLFPRNGRHTKAWHWWKDQPQISVKQIIGYLESGYEVTGIIPENIAIVDCDDQISFEFFEERLGKPTFIYERSISYKEENQKHHIYFKTSNKVPSLTPLKKFGFEGKGELLSSGRLIIFNATGWRKNPASFGTLPILPELFLKKIQSKKQSHGVGADNQFISEGSRNNTLASIAGSLRYYSINSNNIEKILSIINRTQCDPPLNDSEVISITESISKYPTTLIKPDLSKVKEKLKGVIYHE